MREMIRLSFRNIKSNLLRFALTTFAVLLGVSFVVASFVLTDGLRSTFNNMVNEGYSGVAAEVRAERDFDEIDFTFRPIDESLVDVVAEVDGVAEAEPYSDSAKIIPVTADGDPIGSTMAPVFAMSWAGSPTSPMSLVEGEVPDGPGEFALDAGTAENENMVIGETYDLIGIDGPEPFELVGINKFGDENTLGGFSLVSLPLDELQRLDGTEGLLRYIDVAAAPDVDTAELLQRLEAALPNDIEAVSREALVAEGQDDIGGFIDIFGNVLLAFALIAVFVSTFIIGNTFNILLGQRVRQLSLLRALGASSGQVRFGAMFEALIIGVLASILGLGGGALLAVALRSIMSALGFSLPSIDLIISPRTIILALIVGVGVTLGASLSPARRAARVSPMAGMRAGFRFGSGEGTRRTIIAIILAVFGVAGMAYGLFGGTDNTGLLFVVLGLGAVLVFVSVSMFSPLFSSPSASFLGLPARASAGPQDHRPHGPRERRQEQQANRIHRSRPDDRARADRNGQRRRDLAQGILQGRTRLDDDRRLSRDRTERWHVQQPTDRRCRSPARIRCGLGGSLRQCAHRRLRNAGHRNRPHRAHRSHERERDQWGSAGGC